MWTGISSCRAALCRLLIERRAATAVEYGLIIACIVIVMVVSLNGLADVTINIWDDISTRVIEAK